MVRVRSARRGSLACREILARLRHDRARCRPGEAGKYKTRPPPRTRALGAQSGDLRSILIDWMIGAAASTWQDSSHRSSKIVETRPIEHRLLLGRVCEAS